MDGKGPPETAELPGADALLAAAERLRGRIHRTPLMESRTLSEATGGRVLLKCENLQRAGSFKIRGALNACLVAADAGELGAAGVITYSSGNHGQAVALAARMIGCPATVVAPEDIPPVKEKAIEGYGARIVRCGRTSIDRERRALEIAAESGARVIPPFDDRDVIAGQSTVGAEILDDEPRVDLILAPVGGGGLLAGIALAAAARGSRARVVGVEPETANAMCLSLEAGEKVTLPSPPETIADGLRPVAPGDLPLRAAKRHAGGIVLVSDAAIRGAQRLILERVKLLVEPSGATAAAALLARDGAYVGRTIAVVLSGGNAQLPADWP